MRRQQLEAVTKDLIDTNMQKVFSCPTIWFKRMVFKGNTHLSSGVSFENYLLA